jgi:O-antigen biosynthesis protein
MTASATSVIVPVHGNWPVVSRAVAALRTHASERQLVIVDDASPDGTGDALEAENGITLIRNDESAGFGPACNQGAERASGSLLCFLNSDALVEPGAVEALERAMEPEGVGAAAPLLLNPDGTLQEAGGAIGSDGATFPLGRGRAADDPAWCFRRELDYGSAACLLVDRAAFDRLGGFDGLYAPAYYEDADLCLRLAEHGLRTVLEPAARVTHLQYGSGSEARARTLVERNRRTFLERWGKRLDRRPIVLSARAWPHRALALRDAIALTRFLVFRDAELAATLAGQWQRARVTLVGNGGAPAAVESANPSGLERWLDERRFHYSAVVTAGELAPSLVQALERTQPQAPRVAVGPDSLIERLAAAGISPPSEEPRG